MSAPTPNALAPGPAQDDWARFALIEDVRPALAAILAGAAPGALATLAVAEGPSPRKPGAQMAIAPDGRAAGFVSGGCVEGSVAILGMEVAQTGARRLVRFGEGSPYRDVRLTCGGAIELLLEPVHSGDDTLAAVLEAARARAPILRGAGPDDAPSVKPVDPASPAIAMIGAMLWMRWDPPTRLIVLGADPVALALAHVSEAGGIETILVRTDGPAAPPPGLRGRYLRADPAAALAEIGLDAWTAVVTTTHDIEADHAALATALPSPAFYVGALGSRRRRAERLARLEALAPARRNRLRAPVGLDIGARTPFEIAVAILAELVAAMEPLRR